MNGYHNRATLIAIVSDLKSDTTIKDLLAAGVSHVSGVLLSEQRECVDASMIDISIAAGFNRRRLPHQEI